jgi:hypothetical protein
VTFNHGVVGSSPTALTKKSLKIKHLAKRCRATVPTKSGLGTVRVQAAE